MAIKYRIVVEFEYNAPMVGSMLYDSIEEACKSVTIELGKRTWICPVNILCNGEPISACHISSVLVAENGKGAGPLTP